MRSAVLAFGLFALALPARAQYYNSLSGRQFNNMYAANADRIMSQMVQNAGYQAMRASIEAQVKRQAAAPSPPVRAPAAAKAPLAATDFKPAGARRVPEQLAEHAASPRDRQELVTAGRGILKAIEEAPGFRRHNVAAAMTVLVGASLQALSGREIGDAESRAMMAAFNDELAALPAFRALNATERTLMYDTFLVVGGFIAGIAQAGQETNDEQLKAQARAMARDALARFGVAA